MSSSRRARSRHLKRILANALVGILGLITLLLIVGLFLPRRYHVVRSVEISAQPNVIYGDLANLRRWPDWTVWNEAMDPTIKFTFDSPETGVGATYRWTGETVGQGELKLTQANPTNGVAYDLSFENGRYLSNGSIKLAPVGDRVLVTWDNAGDLGKSPIGRYFGLFIDSMLGSQLEQGLAQLKTRAEGGKSTP